jgi:hypothetical protein
MTRGAKIKACAAALAVVLSMPGEARADISTIRMMEWCRPVTVAKPMESYETGMGGLCLGAFIALHALSYDHLYGHDDSMLGVCPPSGVEPIQMVRIFVRPAASRNSAPELRMDGACSVEAGFSMQMICAPIFRRA